FGGIADLCALIGQNTVPSRIAGRAGGKRWRRPHAHDQQDVPKTHEYLPRCKARMPAPRRSMPKCCLSASADEIEPRMPAPLLTLQDIRLGIGSTSLLDGAELSVEAGERLCVVGRNGSGKSTLLRIAAGLIAPDSGRRFAQPGATIQYLPQEPDIARFATTLDCVLDNLAPGDDPQRAYYLLGELGLTGQESPATLS